MTQSRTSDVKRERRKSLFLREITSLIQSISRDEAAVADVYVTQVDLSENSGICYVYFASYKEPGHAVFLKALEVLKLYKPSIRSAIAGKIQSRYTPDFVFMFDKAKEKERRVNDLLNQVQDELSDSKLNQG